MQEASAASWRYIDTQAEDDGCLSAQAGTHTHTHIHTCSLLAALGSQRAYENHMEIIDFLEAAAHINPLWRSVHDHRM